MKFELPTMLQSSLLVMTPQRLPLLPFFNSAIIHQVMTQALLWKYEEHYHNYYNK